MSEIKIRRRSRTLPLTLTTATAAATTLRMEDFAGGVIDLGTMSTAATSLQMWGASDENAPYRRVYKTDGSVADITLAPSSTEGRIYSLPDEVFALQFLRVVSATTNSTGTAGIVTLKS
ncbi:MAG: hypothetical protein EBR82_82015 [Caulobacteraceae bacterium]|nr:hypothetical protein [Caulobacteraceae bacterium]